MDVSWRVSTVFKPHLFGVKYFIADVFVLHILCLILRQLGTNFKVGCWLKEIKFFY